MSLKTFTFPYGHGAESIALPEEHILSVLRGPSVPAADVEAETLRAMREPIASPPLRDIVHPGETVLLVCADCTRAWNHSAQFLIHVVNELNRAGIPDEDISVLFANGTHRAQTHEEDIQVVGEEVARRIRLYQHDSRDKSQLVSLGTTKRGTPVLINRRVTEADRVILIGGITIHPFAGFGGGRKMIFPGVAGWASIQHNHAFALSDTAGGGINPLAASAHLNQNPVSDDLIEGCAMAHPDFLIHSILNEKGEICAIVGGDWYQAWLAGTEIVRKVQRAPMKGRADVVFAGAGGYPKDISLYQGLKCYTPADQAGKPGSILIGLIESPDIAEPAAFIHSFRFSSQEEMEKEVRKEFSMPFFVAYHLYCLCRRHKIIVVTRKENFPIMRRTGQIPAATLEEAWSLAQDILRQEGKTDYTINIIPHSAAIIPTLEK